VFAECVRGRERDRRRADQGGIDQEEREERPPQRADGFAQACRYGPRINELAKQCGSRKGERTDDHQARRTDLGEHRTNDGVEELVAIPAWREPLVNNVGLLEKNLDNTSK